MPDSCGSACAVPAGSCLQSSGVSDLILNLPHWAVGEFNLVRYRTAFHKTKEEAAADNHYVANDETKHRHTYAYQDGKWVPKTRKNYLAILNSWSDCNEVIKTGPNIGATNIHGAGKKFRESRWTSLRLVGCSPHFPPSQFPQTSRFFMVALQQGAGSRRKGLGELEGFIEFLVCWHRFVRTTGIAKSGNVRR